MAFTGFEKKVKFLQETAWGVEPAGSFVGLLLSGPQFQVRMTRETLAHMSNALNPSHGAHEQLVVAHVTAGDIQVPLRVDNATGLIDMGLRTAVGKLNSYVFHEEKSTVDVLRYLGLKSESMTIQSSPREPVTITHSMQGRYETDLSTTGTALTWADPSPIVTAGAPYMHWGVKARFGSTEITKIEDWSIAVENSLDVGRPVALRIDDNLAALQQILYVPSHIEETGHLITGSFTALFETTDWRAQIKGDSTGALEGELIIALDAWGDATFATNEYTPQTAGKKALNLHIPNCYLTESPDAADTGEMQRVTVNWASRAAPSGGNVGETMYYTEKTGV